MTLLEYVKKNRPDTKGLNLVMFECPSRYGLSDPPRHDCDNMTCEECWERKYEGNYVVRVVLDHGAKMPVRAHKLDAGYDLFSRERAVIYPNSGGIFDTGVHVAIPAGYVGFLKSKSGLNVKHSIQSEGVIDSGYTGSIHVKLFNHGSKAVTIEEGQKISQLVILPIITPELELVDALEETERGENGFGSTGAF